MSPDSAAFEPLGESDVRAVLDWLDARYGLPAATLAGHRFWHRPGSPALWLAAAAVSPPRDARTLAVGLCAFRDPPPRGKPSNVFCLRFGAAATRQVCDLDGRAPGAAMAYLSGEALSWPDREAHGWVIVRHGGLVLGRGHLSDGVLVGEMRRSWRAGLSA